MHVDNLNRNSKSTDDKNTPITLVRMIIAKKPLSEKQICIEIFKLTTLLLNNGPIIIFIPRENIDSKVWNIQENFLNTFGNVKQKHLKGHYWKQK